MKTYTWADLAQKYDTHAIGGGEWSIEVYDKFGNFLKEFVGLNGTREGEEATDLWAEIAEWEKEPADADSVALWLECLDNE